MELVFASKNPGKIREISSFFAKTTITIHPIKEDIHYDETGTTFIENAIIKAKSAMSKNKEPVLAEDSGLCVPLLNHQPGLYSAIYAGEHATQQENIELLIHQLKAKKVDHTPAYFICAMVLLRNIEDPLPLIAIGKCNGQVITKASGNHGFGYDPIFYLPDQKKTLAELTTQEKNQISARQDACTSIIQQLKSTA